MYVSNSRWFQRLPHTDPRCLSLFVNVFSKWCGKRKNTHIGSFYAAGAHYLNTVHLHNWLLTSVLIQSRWMSSDWCYICNYAAWYKIFYNRLVWFFVWRLRLFIQCESQAEEATGSCSGFSVGAVFFFHFSLILMHRIPARPVCAGGNQLVHHLDAWYCRP